MTVGFLELLQQIALGLLIAVVTAWVTVRLSLRQFKQQEWWTKRYAAYSKLLELLHFQRDYAQIHLDRLMGEPRRSEESMRELERRWREHRPEYERQMNLATFQLTPNAAAAVKKYRADRATASQQFELYEMIEMDLAATIACIEKIEGFAESDLGA